MASAEYSRMGMGTPEDPSVQHAGQLYIVAVFSRADGFFQALYVGLCVPHL